MATQGAQDAQASVDDVGAERRARSQLDEILTSRQMVFVTGKGGVGKSVVAAALALRARALGLRPVLFECDAPARLSLLPQGRPMRDEVSEVAPGILGINQTSDDAIRDYAASTLPSKTLADLLFENRVARLFLKASPSVTEMALIGRIALLAEKHGADGPVIVDLHATGHAVNLLRAPAGIMRVLQKGGGPLYDRAQRIEQMLQDEGRTAFVTVAVPEELPVTELLELHEKLIALKAPIGPVILNAHVTGTAVLAIDDDVVDALLAHPPTGAAAKDLRFLRAQARRCHREKERLVDALRRRHGEARVVTLPLRLDQSDELLAQRLADELSRKLEAPR